MPSLSETISRLSKLRGVSGAGGGEAEADRLDELEGFGSDPGNLRARLYRPAGLVDGAPLVVVLHGCTQTAGGYDIGSGWSQLADRHGFALLFPEQRRANNPNLCFNWFAPEDNRRDAGEALSIRQMIGAMVTRHGIDPARIFVTGLSAGGAMAAVMLATYPELFAGGAIVAGLPYGTAGTVPQALDRMRGSGMPAGDGLAALVRAASGHDGPWPIVSVWHGSGDSVVSPVNADANVEQWRRLHGAPAAPARSDTVDGYPHRVWTDAAGRAVVEAYSITGMGHGTPLDALAEDGCGRSGAYMLEVGTSSTRHICAFWGLTGARAARAPAPVEVSAAVPARAEPTRAVPMPPPAAKPATGVATGPGKVIEDALRAAGLMR